MKLVPISALVIMQFAWSLAATADTKLIVWGKRYIIPNTAVTAKFYQNKNEPVTFETHVPTRDFMEGTKFQCHEVPWDWNNVQVASQKFADIINSGKSVNELEFLKGQGFGACKEKTK